MIISHAHGDHIGGAEMLQNRGQRILMDPLDWDLVEQFPNRYLTMAPRRDLEAEDGQQLTLGDTTITIWRTPGHTPGTLSYTFTVFDNGRPVNVAYSGGTGFLFPITTPEQGIKDFQTYIDSQKHIAARAAETNATVILSNHSVHDNAVNKIRMIPGRADGPHPFEVGADMVQRYFQVMQHCARAAQIKLERSGIPSRLRRDRVAHAGADDGQSHRGSFESSTIVTIEEGRARRCDSFDIRRRIGARGSVCSKTARSMTWRRPREVGPPVVTCAPSWHRDRR